MHSQFLRVLCTYNMWGKKVNLSLEQAVKAQRRSRRIPLLFFNLGPSCWWVVNATSGPIYPRERDLVPILQEAGWASEPFWMANQSLTSTGVRNLDRPYRSESLYRLRST